MRLRQAAIAVLFYCVLSPTWARGQTSEAYTWNIEGSGVYGNYPDPTPHYFSDVVGTMTIVYPFSDPLAPTAVATVDISLPSIDQGFSGYVYGQNVFVNSSGIDFTVGAGLGLEETAYVDFSGNPGPLDSDGFPESLTPLLSLPGTVVVTPGYHEELTFNGLIIGAASVPEPSGLLTGIVGIGTVSLAFAFRRMKERRARPQPVL